MVAAVLSKNEENVALLYPVSNIDRVFHMLHTHYLSRVDEWSWFNGWKERVDAQQLNETLNSHVHIVLQATPQAMPKKM